MLRTGSLLRKRGRSTFWSMLYTIQDDAFLGKVLSLLIRPVLTVDSIPFIFLAIGSEYLLLLMLGSLGRLVPKGCLIEVGLPLFLKDLHDRFEVIGYLGVVLSRIV